MTKADLGLPSGNQVSTYQQNRDKVKLNYPAGFYAMGKAELRKSYEDLLWENYQLKNEPTRLMDQRIKDLETINQQNVKILQQQDKIIELQSKLNPSEVSPLRIAG